MYLKWFVLLALIARDCSSQDEDGPYRGKYIGKLNSYHHQVSGEVYAVDEWTILLVNFNYDGTGDDTFFWAGDAGRPGPQGFIVPDQHGKTNILERYYNEEVRLTLPEGKRVPRIKWLAVYDIASQNAFGDVYVPDEFEAPAPRAIGPLVGDRAVSSLSVQVTDASTIVIPEFRYDGSGEEVYFWTGVGPQPSSRGIKIPDDYGYLEPLRAYKGEDVTLQLPGGRTVFDVKWVAVYDVAAARALASVLVPDALNVPPAPLALHPYRSNLPHCKQLHRDYQVSWEKFGNQITIELAARLEPNEYMAFGISGNESRSQMLGADVAVARYDAAMQRGLATDYNITAQAPCVQVLGQWRGVCRDELLGGLDSNQVFTADSVDGLTRVSYRRVLKPFEPMDREWAVDRPQYVVWAVGPLDHAGEPAFHRLSHRQDLALNLDQNPPVNDCFNFTIGSSSAPAPWEVAELFDPALRVFTFRLGPAGARRGVAGRRLAAAAPPLAWYVNGQLAPDLQLRRGLKYTFKVLGGNNPHSATEYHPLIVSVEREGGLERLTDAEQRQARVLAGVHRPRRGRLAPTAGHGSAMHRTSRGGRGPAARRRLRLVPRLQPLAALGLRPRRPASAAARRAQRLLARHRLLQLIHARRHGRAHLRGGPAPAQHRQAPRLRRARSPSATAAAAAAAATAAARLTAPASPGTAPASPGTAPTSPGTAPASPGTAPTSPAAAAGLLAAPASPAPAARLTAPASPGTAGASPGTVPASPGTAPASPAAAAVQRRAPAATPPAVPLSSNSSYYFFSRLSYLL